MKLKGFAQAALILAIFISPYAIVDALDRHDAQKAQEKAQATVRVVEITKPAAVIKPTKTVAKIATVAEPDVAIPEPDEDEKIQTALIEKAVLVGETKITHYCICKKCCGKDPDHPAYGITASGAEAKPYVTVAVDPDIIPLGSDVLVDYGDGIIQAYIAQDTGSGVNGSHIDLCVEDHQTAINLGVKTAKVWFIAPEDKE